jgi:hypothetical protein
VPWQAGVEGRRHAARGGARKRAAGAGARHQLVFDDRLVATLIHLRHDLPRSVLGLLFGVDRSTITRAITEIRPLLADRGCALPDRPDLPLRPLADVFAYAQGTTGQPIAELELRHRLRAGPRTPSGLHAPPACGTCPCTTPRRTGFSWRSSRSHSTCWPGCRCLP